MNNKPANFKQKLAFSIVELSIVVVIVSILIGLVISADKMVSTAHLSSARTITKSSPVPDIDNLVLWLETTMPQSFDDLEADDQEFVNNWHDLSPEISGATIDNSPNDNPPQYISGAINDLPALRFDGTDDYFVFNGSRIVQDNYTIFVVEQRRGGGVNYFLAGSSTAENENLLLGYAGDTTLTLSQEDDSGHDSAIAGYASAIPRIHSFMLNSAIGKTYRLNGSNLAIGNSGSTNVSNLLSYEDSRIGRFNANYYNGDIAEIIIYNKALTNDEIIDVEQYLSTKWNIVLP
ncbi:MAG: hypothetical protein ACJAW3_000322 [Lentimonas sp.]|jgi:hypothetical protein